MSDLTPEEGKWLKRVQRALDACPSSDIGFYTVGDRDVSVYRRPPDDFEDCMGDFCQAVEGTGADLGSLNFPQQVHATAG